MTENDILNAMCDRRIVKAYWKDPSEAELIIELHDGLKVEVQSVWSEEDSFLELELLNE